MKKNKHPIFTLQENCFNCQKCPLGIIKDNIDPHVFGAGNVNANIMFIGEAPGEEEVLTKKLLVGRSGIFFDTYILKLLQLKRSKIYITNSVLCKPKNNRTPIPTEIDICKEHLDAQILLIKPKIIVTLGNTALFAVTESSGIKKKHGLITWSRQWSDNKCIPVFPLFHPSYCLRGFGLKEMNYDISVLYKYIHDINNNEWIDNILKIIIKDV